MKLSSSTRIAIVFSFFTFLVSLFFTIIFNYFSFKSWYSEENKEINQISIGYNLYSQIFDEVLGKTRKTNRYLDDFISKEYLDEEYYKLFWDIYYEDDEFYIIKKIGDSIYFKYDVSIFMSNQIFQLKTGLFLTLIFAIFSFLLSKNLFSRIILKELYILSDSLSSLNIENNEKIKNSFYDKDINLITEKINTLLDRIYENQKDLKYFNSQVSHEFKTPLMVISSELEFLSMEGLENSSIKKIQMQVDKLNTLLESFVLLTRIENQNNIKLEKVSIDTQINNIINDLKEIYKNKNLQIQESLKNCEIKTNLQLNYILLKNVLENAFKYSKSGGKVKIYFDCKTLIIENEIEGANIDKNQIFNIFYKQENNSKGFGIGLAIVKKIAKVLNYDISVDIKDNKFIFKVNYDK